MTEEQRKAVCWVIADGGGLNRISDMLGGFGRTWDILEEGIKLGYWKLVLHNFVNPYSPAAIAELQRTHGKQSEGQQG